MKKFLTKKKGFTLAELLIVVAIIAVLTAIAIPVFAGELEKSREATDLANIRAAYAEITTAAISSDGTAAVTPQTISLKQSGDGWKLADAQENLEHIVGDEATYVVNTPKAGGSVTIAWVAATDTAEGHCTITFSE